MLRQAEITDPSRKLKDSLKTGMWFFDYALRPVAEFILSEVEGLRMHPHPCLRISLEYS
jgi:hypothetical protein